MKQLDEAEYHLKNAKIIVEEIMGDLKNGPKN
ncbi:hypothetical protein LCGC14_0576940 [marine sediment metagenome]|uniref:Uncharacterized protein n=1 Tax=marine sediment metagenome TaxID=412755 RepID=A0A0F9S122_9ZZZZ